jgi:hypothetical protein
VAADGTKVLAHASKHSAVSYQRAGEMIAQLELEVQQLLAKAEQADATPLQDGLTIPEEVNRALGARDARKNLLVAALMNHLLLRPDRPPLPTELQAFWEPIERTNICHYAFP